MISKIIIILTAHFFIELNQGEWLARKKRESILHLALHCIMYALFVSTAFIVCGLSTWYTLPALLISHYCMDYIKTRYMRDSNKSFIIYQAFHLIIIFLLIFING